MALAHILVAVAGFIVPSTNAFEAGSNWHRLQRNEPSLRTFDKTVLGNLKDPNAVANAEVPRYHHFVTTVDVGTPPQTLLCLLDTGSADLWLPSKRCKECGGYEHRFNARKSETFMPAVTRSKRGYLPVPIRVDYGSGDVAGFLVQDTVRLGWQAFPNQSFIVVEEEKLPRHRSWDGICGLGWRQMAKAGRPLYRSLHDEGGRAIFSLVPGPDMAVYLVVGEAPLNACPSGLTYVPAEPIVPGGERSYWAVSGDLHVASANSGSRRPWNARFVIDSGTEFLLVPRKHHAEFLRALLPLEAFDHLCGIDTKAGGLVICDCAITSNHKIDPRGIRMVIGGRSFALDIPKLFKRVPKVGGGELCLLQVQQNSMQSVDPVQSVGNLLGFEGPDAVEPRVAGASPRQPKPQREPARVPYELPQGFAHDAATAHTEPHATPLMTDRETVKVTTQEMPDGAECTTRTVVSAGKVISNMTTCSEPQSSATVRRLDVMDDIWVLGGVFLERFVLVLDFEEHRIGFGVPSFADPSPRQPQPQPQSHPQPRPRPQPQQPRPQPQVQAQPRPHMEPPQPEPMQVGSAGLQSVSVPRIAATPPVPRPAGGNLLSGSGHLPDNHQVGSFPWGAGLLAALAAACAAGGTSMCRKFNRRKCVSDPAPVEPEEDPSRAINEPQSPGVQDRPAPEDVAAE